MWKLIRLLISVFFIVVILPQTGYSKQVVVPLLESGDQIYLATQVEVGAESGIDGLMPVAVRENEKFISDVKSRKYSDLLGYFSKKDSSFQTINKKDNLRKSFFLYEKVSEVKYSDPFVWGSYLHIPTEYSIDGKIFKWREDFLCTGKECLRTVEDSGQLFEFAYDYYYKKKNLIYDKSLKNSLLQKGYVRTFEMSMGHGGVRFDQASTPSFLVGISIAPLETHLCFDCRQVTFRSQQEEALLLNISKLMRDIASIDETDLASVSGVVGQYSDYFNASKGIPIVSWSSDYPHLVHTDAMGYLRELKEYAEGKPAGYMLDGEYAYLLLTKTVKRENKKIKRFQIVILKKGGGGTYKLLPHSEKQLDTRSLMFDDKVLELLKMSVT